MKTQKTIGTFIVYLLLILGSIFCLFPFYWMIRTSLVGTDEIFQVVPSIIPHAMKWENYKNALTAQPFGTFFMNTAFVTISNIVGVLLTSSLCAYGFSRLDWPGRDKVFGFLMTALMLPFAVVMIPHFIGWSYLGLTNTYAPLIVPAFFGGGLFNIFLLRQFFMSIPKELDEAAYMDGANHLKVYSRIIVPLSKQAMIVVGLFTFLNNWNDYLAPVLYISAEKKYTLMLGLTLFQGQYSAQWNIMMAAVAIVVLPSLIIFLFAQRYFIEGIAMTGVKG
ncbi:multiple sugar transport system permease protein [Paenibacillus sp. V4I3]|uniref:carbohydrate ABC transporter permease n=1 Tax=unclassified Paenibacillus TaxID=185978 RepID=UPI002781B40A|nr:MULTISPECIES: carbohydrate ABC transporter permease [unclassified Paenibacillus]MDQ0877384.1 multiple sugar transport system permease protein [Paenibacillus sp. V4I3]MDQ0886751.1 multiple sugar transport system permease protein [Paenibacillus sp. V4I9]